MATPPVCEENCGDPILPEGTPTVPPVILQPFPGLEIPAKPEPMPMPPLDETGLPQGYGMLRHISDAEWNWFFPLRKGNYNPDGGAFNKPGFALEDGSNDLYTLDAFKKAVVIYNTWAANKNYPQFINQGSLNLQATEFAAFMANVSLTTSGSELKNTNNSAWAENDKLVGRIWKGGLYHIEAEGFSGNKLGSIDGASAFKPAPKQSYHGRGVFHMSWNHNYGAFSEWLFSNGIMTDIITSKRILVEQPSLVGHNATLSMLSGIWQWMTPVGAKPSAHDVIHGNVSKVSEGVQDPGLPQSNDNMSVPTAYGETTDSKAFAYRIGTITNILNGGLECNKIASWNAAPVQRVAYYNAYSTYVNSLNPDFNAPQVMIDGDNIDPETGLWTHRVIEESSQELKYATCYSQLSYYTWTQPLGL